MTLLGGRWLIFGVVCTLGPPSLPPSHLLATESLLVVCVCVQLSGVCVHHLGLFIQPLLGVCLIVVDSLGVV